MFKPFRDDNTEGMAQSKMDALNTEFARRYESGEWDDYVKFALEPEIEAAKHFCDEVARRTERSKAAAALGSIRTEKKAAACRENARKPRPNAQGKAKPRKGSKP